MEVLAVALKIFGFALLFSIPVYLAYLFGYNRGFQAQRYALKGIFAQMSISPYSARDTLKAMLKHEAVPEDVKELIKMCLPDEKAPEKEKAEATQKPEKPKKEESQNKQEKVEERVFDLSGVVVPVLWTIVALGSIFAVYQGVVSAFAWFSGLANQEKVALVISVVIVLAVFLNAKFSRPRRRNNFVSKNPDRLL